MPLEATGPSRVVVRFGRSTGERAADIVTRSIDQVRSPG